MTQWANRHVYNLLQVGDTSNYLLVSADGTVRTYGTATAYDDLRVEGMSTRSGTVAPQDTTGFRGDANHQVRNFVHTQADEVQFLVQLPHAWREGSKIYPHVHFMPTTAGGASNAARFVLEYYVANVDAQYPASPSTIQLTKTWAGDKQWYHLIADNATGVTMTGLTLSNVIKCRIYRDNTVTNNIGAAVTFLYFDIHFEVDAFGSAEEYSK